MMELNKAIAAVLIAGIVFFGAGMFTTFLVHPLPAPEANKVLQVNTTTFAPVAGAEAPAAAPAAAEAAAGTAAPAAPAAAAPAAAALPPVGPLLAAADPEAGKTLARRLCATCHTFDQGGRNGAGPNLWNVVGGPHGHAEGFNYSPVIKGMHDQVWSYEELNRWLASPRDYATGNRMAFAGLRDPKQRADVIAYLRSLSENPQPLP